MRDRKRIPIILRRLEKIWEENPDYRLGQLITIATRPKYPCPEVFYIEDEDLVNGISLFEDRAFVSTNQKSIPYWDRCPNICLINTEDISIEMIKEMIISQKLIKIFTSSFAISKKMIRRLSVTPR